MSQGHLRKCNGFHWRMKFGRWNQIPLPLLNFCFSCNTLMTYLRLCAHALANWISRIFLSLNLLNVGGRAHDLQGPNALCHAKLTNLRQEFLETPVNAIENTRGTQKWILILTWSGYCTIFSWMTDGTPSLASHPLSPRRCWLDTSVQDGLTRKCCVPRLVYSGY